MSFDEVWRIPPVLMRRVLYGRDNVNVGLVLTLRRADDHFNIDSSIVRSELKSLTELGCAVAAHVLPLRGNDVDAKQWLASGFLIARSIGGAELAL